MPPPILYRYRSLSGESFKHTQDMFLRARIFLSAVSAMNDPSEGNCELELPGGPLPPNASQAEIYGRGNQGWGLQLRHSQSLRSTRLASFSATRTNPLLWAHYADSHRGICVGFSTSATPELSAAVPIQYSASTPVWRGDGKDLTATVFATKSLDWAYEEEWRVFSTGTPHLPLKPSSVAEIILGARITAEDESWVRDWIQLGGLQATILRAKPETRQYSMRIEPA
jgi:hypothetical protein